MKKILLLSICLFWVIKLYLPCKGFVRSYECLGLPISWTVLKNVRGMRITDKHTGKIILFSSGFLFTITEVKEEGK